MDQAQREQPAGAPVSGATPGGSAARAVEHGRAFWTSVGVLTVIGIALVPVVLLVSILVTLAGR